MRTLLTLCILFCWGCGDETAAQRPTTDAAVDQGNEQCCEGMTGSPG